MKNLLRVLISIVVLAAAASSSFASWGDYDTTFGFLGAAIDGSVSSHTPYGVAVQSDGKILVTGYRLVSGKKRFFLRRYLSNGQVDTSFGNNGSATWSALINIDADYYGQRIVVQANGKIAVAGIGNGYPVIWRFSSSGSGDTSFGSGGMKTLSAYESVSPRIATFSNILYVGVVDEVTNEVFVIKFNSSGSQDTSFGSGGEAFTDMDYRGFTIAIEPTTGNILVGGRQTYNDSGYGVIRFLTSGVLDPGFTNFGATFSGFPGYFPDQFVRLANGQFVMNERWVNIALGGGTVGSNLVRLNTIGAFTTRIAYGPTGFVTDFSGDCPDVMAQQADGKVIAKTVVSDKLYRFSTTFSTVQTMTCGSYSTLTSPTPAVLQSDDKMIAAGTYNGNIALVRTLP